MSRKVNWRASERFLTTTFPVSDRSLSGVRFRLRRGVEPTADAVHHLDESPLESASLQPELFLQVDSDQLASDTQLPADTLVVSVIVRDRVLNWFQLANTWRLDALPEDGWNLGAALTRLSPASRMDIAVVATPHMPVTNALSVHIPEGTVLARKVFFLRPRTPILDDLIRRVDPDEMVAEGLPRGTVCYVKWKGEDVNAMPGALLEVWLNKDFEDKFEQLSARGANAAARQIARGIAADVYGDILAHVLQSDEEGDDPGTLVRMVERLLEQKLRISLTEARRIYRIGPEGRARLTPWCWRLAGADAAFAGLTF